MKPTTRAAQLARSDLELAAWTLAAAGLGIIICLILALLISGNEPSNPTEALPWFDSAEGRDAAMRAEQEAVWIAREELYYTKVAVLVSVFGAVALSLTLLATFVSIGLTRRAIQVQDDNARKLTRAYLDVKTLPIEGFEHGKSATCGVEILNTGQTMAFDVKIKCEAIFIAKYREKRWSSLRDRTPPTPTYLGAGQYIRARRQTRKITRRVMKYMRTKDVGIWWVGEVTYRDVFGEKHEFTFSRCYLGPMGRRFTTTPSGDQWFSMPELVAQSKPVEGVIEAAA